MIVFNDIMEQIIFQFLEKEKHNSEFTSKFINEIEKCVFDIIDINHYFIKNTNFSFDLVPDNYVPNRHVKFFKALNPSIKIWSEVFYSEMKVPTEKIKRLNKECKDKNCTLFSNFFSLYCDRFGDGYIFEKLIRKAAV